MIDPEEIEPNQEIELKVRSAFQIQDPDQAFIDRLQNKLANRFRNIERPSQGKDIFSRRSHWLDKSKILFSPLAWGAIAIIFLLFMIWGIKTLIPKVQPSISSQLSPTPGTSPSPSMEATQAEGLIHLPVLAGMPVPWPVEAITSMNASQITQLAGWGKDPIWAVTWAPDGKSFAVASASKIHIYDTVTFKELITIDNGSNAYLLAYSPDGARLAAGSYDSPVKIWEVASGSALQTLEGSPNPTTGLAFSPEGVILGSGTYDNEGPITLWDASTGQQLRTLCRSAGYMFALSPDWSVIATVSGHKTIQLWDVASGEDLRSLAGHIDDINGITFSPDGSRLASWSFNMLIKLWDVATGIEQSTLIVQGDFLRNVALLPDEQTLAYISNARPMTILDIASGQVLRTYGDNAKQGEMALSPDGKMVLLYAFQGEAIKLFDITGGEELRKLDIASADEIRKMDWQSYAVGSIKVSPDGRIVAVGMNSGVIKLLDAANGQELRTLTGHTNQVARLAFSPDGAILASGAFDVTVKLWDVASGQELQSFIGADVSFFGGMPSVAISPDGKTLAYGAPLGQVKLWDIANNNELRALGGVPAGGSGDDVNSVAFSPDGKMLAAGYGSGSITLWDATDGEELRSMTKLWSGTVKKSVTDLAFSPDGRILVSGSNDMKISVMDVSSLNELRMFTLLGEPDRLIATWIISLAFSPNGEVLAAGSEFGPIMLWDITSGKELNTLAGASAMAFSPDGKLLISGSYNSEYGNAGIRLWGIAPLNAIPVEANIELPGEEITMTQEAIPSATPEELNIEKIPIPVAVTGNNLQWGGWSFDGSYFYYTDLGPLNEPAPNQAIKTLSFLDARTGATCPSYQETVSYTQDEWGAYPDEVDITERTRWTDDNRLLYISPSGELLALTPCSDSTENWSTSLLDRLTSFGRGGSLDGSQVLLKGEKAYWLLTPSTLQSLKLAIPAPQEGREISLAWSESEPKLISSRLEDRQGELWIIIESIDPATGNAALITEIEASPELNNWFPMYSGIERISQNQILVENTINGKKLLDLNGQPLGLTDLYPGLSGNEFPGIDNAADWQKKDGMGSEDYHLVRLTGMEVDGKYYIYHPESGTVDQYPLDSPLLVIFPNGKGEIVFPNMMSSLSNNVYKVILVDTGTEPYDLVAKGHTLGQYFWSLATLLPDSQRVMFSSIQGISLVDIKSRKILNFWGLENQEQYVDLTVLLSPDGMSMVGFASATAPGQGNMNQAIYWLRLEP